ncbi:MAG: Nramp family divalent metal transporter, partial [Planctomycetes bacterium]|nr:Nramp family divalent metal transporter [Planctomycetota bacterium]
SLVTNANMGANYGYGFLWLLAVTAVLMATYTTMAARIGVLGGATPCTLIASRLGRPAAAVIGVVLALVCASFQFSNNLAAVAALRSLVPAIPGWLVLVALNGLIVLFLFTAREIYRVIERAMKVMVAVILVSFISNLAIAGPRAGDVLAGFIPGIPEPRSGEAQEILILIPALIGTTFSVAAAFFQGNLVREKGWTIREYTRGIGDAIAGVTVLASVSAIIMVTTATVIPGKPATDVGALAQALSPLLGPTAHAIFCVGLFAVAMNPFLINAMIAGTILADGFGKPARLADPWPRRLSVAVLVAGMVVALYAIESGGNPVRLVLFGQGMTVLGNPLMALALLWLANRKDVMGERRNTWPVNILGGIGFLAVLAMALRVIWILRDKLA